MAAPSTSSCWSWSPVEENVTDEPLCAAVVSLLALKAVSELADARAIEDDDEAAMGLSDVGDGDDRASAGMRAGRLTVPPLLLAMVRSLRLAVARLCLSYLLSFSSLMRLRSLSYSRTSRFVCDALMTYFCCSRCSLTRSVVLQKGVTLSIWFRRRWLSSMMRVISAFRASVFRLMGPCLSGCFTGRVIVLAMAWIILRSANAASVVAFFFTA
mmetsp:Transcript_20275/g.53192  ORF Transcript_20275/g.53192 Transcript_20275/m.53192 type:complete len:213 (-) Transcript_20275:255-893(-)